MKLKPVFKASGQYFGFIQDGSLFDADCNYVGWLDANDHVWRNDGFHLGQLVLGKYVLRHCNVQISGAEPRLVTRHPVPPCPQSATHPVELPDGWVDALEALTYEGSRDAA